MTEAYLLLGSNKEDRKKYIDSATSLIEYKCGKIISQSSVYETEAWGEKAQNAFLNKAIRISTSLHATDLLSAIKHIEKETGRTQSVHWGPREIDIDILYYGETILQLPQLSIPHPYLHQRKFTLVPLLEIAPQLLHPILKKNTLELLSECNDNSLVTYYPSL